MTRRLGSGIVLVLLSLMLSGHNLVRAQEATPGSGESGLPVTPDPSECTVTEPTVEEVLARVEPLMASPVATPAETPFTLPTGTPANAATVDAITALLREYMACLNAGDVLTLVEFSTDEFLVRLFSEQDEGEEEGEEGVPDLSATVPPEMWASLTAVHHVVVLSDGRVGALVEADFPEEEPGVQVEYFYFAWEGDQWLLDDIVSDLEGQFPPASGTAAAA